MKQASSRSAAPYIPQRGNHAPAPVLGNGTAWVKWTAAWRSEGRGYISLEAIIAGLALWDRAWELAASRA